MIEADQYLSNGWTFNTSLTHVYDTAQSQRAWSDQTLLDVNLTGADAQKLRGRFGDYREPTKVVPGTESASLKKVRSNCSLLCTVFRG